MTTIELLTRLRGLNVKLWSEHGRLRFQAPKGVLTDELRQALAEHKAEVLALLQEASIATQEAPAPIQPARLGDMVPLSFAQQRLWFLDQLEPGSPLYNIPSAVRLSGRLDVGALQRSFDTIAERHATLRTTFATVDQQPVQVIAPVAPVDMPLIDLRGLPLAEREATARRLADQEALRPFDLARGPLLRITLLQLEPTEYLVLFTMHHIISDGWSIGVVIHELALLYQAFAQDRPSPLPDLPIQYVDFAVWQRQWLQDEILEQQLSYWKQQLHGAPAALDLPTDRPRPPTQTFAGATMPFKLPLALSQALYALSQREGATLFMTLLAAFQTLLFRYSGQTDILVGSPIANRTRKELDGLIGVFVNTLVLRGDLSGNPAFVDLLGRVRHTALEAFAHQDLPFERLVEAVRPARDLSRSPLFQIMLVLQNVPSEALDLPDLTLRPVAVDSGTAKFDLLLSMAEQAGGLAGTLEYNTDLFDHATIARMLGHFQTLLEGIVADPNRPIDSLPLLTEAERQTFDAWNSATLPYPPDRCIHELVEQQVARTPEQVAVIDGTQRVSYRELNQRANQLAHALRARGVGPEVRVGICMARTVDLLVGVLGILKAGAAYVPLDPAYPPERLAFMLDDSGASVLLTAHEARYHDTAPSGAVPAEALVPQFRGPRIDLAGDWPAIAAYAPSNPAGAAMPSNLAYLIYTSGSTGRPKGVAIEHHSVVALLAWAHTSFAPEQLRGMLASTSICFDLSVFEIFAPLSAGGTVILAENALALPTLPAAGDVTLVNTVPSAMAALLRTSGLPPAVRTVNLAGEPLPLVLVQQIYATTAANKVYNLYGPSEDTTYSTYALIEHDATFVPIGRPLANTQAYVLDARLQQTPIGVPGELYLGGDGVTRGYFARPDLTAATFIPDPSARLENQAQTGHTSRMYKTGDLARYRADGQLEFLGRVDHQVKLRGFRIELGEVEAVLLRHPNVRDVVVVAREDTPGDNYLAAYLAPDPAQPPTVNGLRRHLQAQLPDYMLPSAFVMLDALPLTPNGKIDRKALPAPDGARPELEHGFVAPRSSTEAVLVELWSEVLGTRRVGVHDSFFELGGHSLLATQLVSRVREALQIDLPLRDVFAAPTVAGLAELIEISRAGDQTEDDAPLLPLDRTGPLPLSFSQERLWFLNQLAPDSPLYNMPFVLRITGHLDTGALERCFNALIDRHETLRTTFILGEERPVQVIAPPVPIVLPCVDLRSLPEDEREATARMLVNAEVETIFDLARGPLFRVKLFRLNDAESVVAFTMHHIIADGWSIGVIMGDLGKLYSAFTRGEQPSLAQLPIQYADYAVWQRRWLQGAVLERQLHYWKQQLGSQHSRGAVPLLNLPTDRPRPSVQTFNGKTIPFTLPQPLTDALNVLSQREQVTLFMALLAAFQVLLSRYSGQDDIAVGAPIANRNRREIEPLIGCFINTLVLRTDLSGAPSFRELLGRVRQSTLGAYDHQDLPFELLVDSLQPTRQLRHNSLFQVMFVLQNTPMQALDLPDIRLSMAELETETAKTDLTLEIVPIGERLTGSFAYNIDLFDQATIERMLAHFVTLLQGIVANPGMPITHLPLLSAAEQRQLLVEWNETAVASPADTCIHTAFEAQAERTPHAVAVVSGRMQLTYQALNRRANQLAHYLRTLGVGPETLVGLCVERSAEMIVGLLGILKAGAAYVPLDPTYPPERLAFMIADGQLPVLLTAATEDGHTPFAKRQTQIATGTVIDMVGDSALIAAQPDHDPCSGATAESLAYVIYTSGSTGKPKGVMIEHHAVLNLATALDRAIYSHHGGRPLRVSLNAPLSFDASVQQLVTLLSGHTLYVLPERIRRDGHALVAYLRDNRLDVFDCVPSQLKLLLGAGLLDDAHRAPAAILAGGEAIDDATWHTLARAPQTHVYNVYGPTECTVDSTTIDARTAPDRATIGRPLANAQLYILDQNRQVVPIGVPGELYIGGAGVARGYLNRPELTAERFVDRASALRDCALHSEGRAIQSPDATLYKTGDLVRYLPDGRIEFLGRIDTQVKIRGFRIELGEIEAALREHPALREAVVVAREDTPGDKRLVAYLVADTSPVQAVSELRSFLMATLPEYMVPAVFMYLDALPLTPNGKVDRNGLPAPSATRPELKQAYVAPRIELERLLAGMWAEHFHVERVGIHDTFFELGGNSIQGAVFINRLQELLGEYISVIALFEAPNIADLARYLVSHHRAALTRAGLLTDADEDRGQPVASVAEHGQLGQILPVPRGQGGLLPLSFAQQRLWFLDQLEPGSPLYNIPNAVRLHGKLDPEALRRSIDVLIERHESLRTTFSAIDGQPIQVVAPRAYIALDCVDLRTLPPAERDAAVHDLAVREAQQPFDLERGPLMRASLALLDTDEHVLLFTLHHIITDGWSMGILIRELAAVYMAVAHQRPVTLPELTVQYADFAVWQRDWFQGPLLEQQLAYWKDQLRGAAAALDLPNDRPRPLSQSFRGATVPFTVPVALTQALQELGQRAGATLFMTLLAAWQTLLFRYTGQHDISVGSPIANRTRKEIEGLIGFFVNTLVLRTDLSGNPSFMELLTRVRQVSLGAFAHQDLPFEYLVEAVQPERDLSRSPLFQVMLVLQNAPSEALELPDLTLQPLDAHSGTAKFDLLLSLVEQPNGLAGDLEYNTDLFDHTTMARLLGHFQTLLESIVANPAQPIGSLALLTNAERQQQLVAWNATAAPYPALGVHQLVAQQAARTPDAPAVVYGDRHLSYHDLEGRANQLAHHLRKIGVGADVPVGLCMERSLELVVGILGILKAGGAYVPLDPSYPAERLALMLGDARAPVLLTAPSAAGDRHAMLQGRFFGTQVDLVDDWPAISRQPSYAPDSAVDLDQLAYVIYTSGSTGIPKGVAMSHRPLVNLLVWQPTVLPGAARTLQFSSPSFDVSFQEIFTTWAGGGTLVLPPETVRRDPEALAAFLDTQRIERLFMPFVALQQLAEALLAEGRVPAYLRDVITAGEQLQITPAISEWFRGSPRCRLHNHYGPTETHVVTAHTLSGDPALWPALPPIGKPIANTRAYLLDRAAQPLPIGAIGDLYFGGDILARGYLHRPELTAERFISLELEGTASVGSTRLYKTGDLARYLPDGTLEFLGRADTQVKIRGYRVEPGEIENVLAQHAAVREAVVVVRPNAHGVAQLAAYVVAGEREQRASKQPNGDGATPADQHPLLPELRAFLKQKLPDYMVPSAFVVLERWPLTPSGKIDRRALPAPGALSGSTSDTFVAPRDSLELRLARIWEQLLGLQTVGVRDSFFELGGHSLLVVRLMAQIQGQLGLKIPLATLFQEPTIEHLARTLRQFAPAPVNTPLVTLQSGGSKLPFFCVHPAAGSVLSYLELARLLGPDQPFYGLQAAGIEGEQPPNTQVEQMAAVYLAALRQAQPTGPYLLGGWSFGGLVAYEMARRLTEQGHEVALLALFDTWAPTPDPSPTDQTTLLMWFANDLSRTVGADLAVSAETLAAVAPEQQLRYVLEQARTSGRLPPDIGEREIGRYLDVFTASLRAMQAYRPQLYPGRVTLFRAGDRPLDDAGETLGWQALAADGVSLRVVPGDHYGIVRQPHVAALANQLRASLEQAQTLREARAVSSGLGDDTVASAADTQEQVDG